MAKDVKDIIRYFLFCCTVVVVAAIIAAAISAAPPKMNWGEWANRALFAAAALAGLGALCVSAITAFVAMAFLRAVQEASGMAQKIKVLEQDTRILKNKVGSSEDKQGESETADKVKDKYNE